jgi:hypothetical protein
VAATLFDAAVLTALEDNESVELVAATLAAAVPAGAVVAAAALVKAAEVLAELDALGLVPHAARSNVAMPPVAASSTRRRPRCAARACTIPSSKRSGARIVGAGVQAG